MELEGVRNTGAWPFWGRYPLLEAGEREALCSWLCPPEWSFRHSHLVRGQLWGAWRKEAFHVSNAINSCCSNQDLAYFLFLMFIHLLCSLRITFGDVKSVFYSFHQLQLFHWEKGPHIAPQTTVSEVVYGLLLFWKSSLMVGLFCESRNQLSPIQLAFLIATTPWSWEWNEHLWVKMSEIPPFLSRSCSFSQINASLFVVCIWLTSEFGSSCF